MYAFVEGNYALFETNLFSHYILADTSMHEYKFTVSIRTPSTASVDYGDIITLNLDIDTPLPDGAYI